MRRLAVVVAVLLMAAACTAEPPSPTVGIDQGTSTGTEAVTGTSPIASPDEDLPEVLAFTADVVGGQTFDGGEYAGQDLMLWFWAPW